MVCLAESAETAALIREVLVTSLPSLDVLAATPSALRLLPDAHCLVVCDAAAGHGATELLRRARAAGFSGAAVLVAALPSPDVAAGARQLGASAIVTEREAMRELPAAVSAALAAEAGRGTTLPDLRAELRRTQQLIAAGGVALRLQHALNNPLTALLAEAQLLEMEELPREHHAAAQRIVELCRRTIAVVRQLDGITTPGAPRGEG